MKKLFLFTLCLVSGAQSAFASCPSFTDVLKNSDGTAIINTNDAATFYCQKALGLRLPNLREWTQWASCHGAVGASENPTASSYRIDEFEYGNGEMHSYYYSHIGYVRPNDGSEKYKFCTSSREPYHNDFGQYAFDAASGKISGWQYYSSEAFCAIRCVKTNP